jgi:hypothetical protein
MQNSAKMGYVSDTHLSSPDPNSLSLFPRWLETLPREKRDELYGLMARETHRAFESALNHLRGSQPDAIIHLGDVTGGWQEQGMVHPSVHKIARKCRDDLSAIAPANFCLGNHDLGGVNAASLPESIAACEDAVGPLHWKHKHGDLLSLGICSPIAGYQGKEETVLARQRAQESFVIDALREHSGLPWAFYMHDLQPLPHLRPHIAPYMEECQKIVHGHLHNPIAGQLMKARHCLVSLVKDDPVSRALPRVAKLCPSTAPLWWPGYRMLDAEWKNATLRTKQVFLKRSAESEDNPAASFLRCTVARLRPPKKGLPEPA